MSFEIKLRIDARAAIGAGHALLGVRAVSITDDNLKELDSDERLELARIVENDEVLGGVFNLDETVLATDQPAWAPTFAAVHLLLRNRAKERAAFRENQRLQAEEDLRRKAREEEAAALQQRADEARQAEQRLAIHRWVEEHGSDSQKARFQEGLLSDDEVLEAVREQLFEPLDGNEGYVRLAQSDVCHCSCEAAVEFKTLPPRSMSEAAFEKLAELRAEAPKGSSITPRLHRGACDQCSCRAVERLGAAVVMEWSGFTLGKEYVLDE